jgi:MGT family glycosyltransferase
MSKILIAVTPLPGHVNPMLVVADFLSKRGHDVFFNTSELFRVRGEACGQHFLPLLGSANYDYRQLGQLIPELRIATSPADQTNRYVRRLFGDRIPDQYNGLCRIIEEHAVDLVMTDVLFFGMLPLLFHGGNRPPVISCGVIAPFWHDAAASVFTGPDNTPEGRERNLEHSRQFIDDRASGLRHVDAVLEELGVVVPGGFEPNTLYRMPDLFLQFGAEAFEYPMYHRPANLRFTGPILPKRKDTMKVAARLEGLDRSKPLVFVTQGTLANFNFGRLVNPSLAGLAEEDVQLIVTAGGGRTEEIVAPANAIVEQYIPYEVLLPSTNVFVTNGGYNGVQEALSYGVPIVAAGLGEDKAQVCARVNWSGTGIGLATGSPTGKQMRDAVREVLRDPIYRERAQVLGAEIAKTDGLTTIAGIVEATIGEGAPHKVGSPEPKGSCHPHDPASVSGITNIPTV